MAIQLRCVRIEIRVFGAVGVYGRIDVPIGRERPKKKKNGGEVGERTSYRAQTRYALTVILHIGERRWFSPLVENLAGFQPHFDSLQEVEASPLSPD